MPHLRSLRNDRFQCKTEQMNRVAPYFVHPIPLTAVLLMVVNDHILKHQFSSWWTGKLSDFLGLFFFPLFLCASFEAAERLVQKKQTFTLNRFRLLSAIFLTSVAFVEFKLSGRLASLYASLVEPLGYSIRVWHDPSDLLALTSGYLCWRFAKPDP